MKFAPSASVSFHMSLALLAAFQSGCSNAGLSTTRVAVVPYQTSGSLDPANSGFVFFWPRTGMLVEYGFSVVRYKAFLKGAPGEKDIPRPLADKYEVRPASGDQALKITFNQSQDLDFGFMIPVDMIQSPYTNSKELKFGTDEKFMLTSVNGDFEDKKKEIIKSYISTAVTIAKFAAGVPKAASDDIYYEREVLASHSFTIGKKVWISDLLEQSASKSSGGGLIWSVDLSEEMKEALQAAAQKLNDDASLGGTKTFVIQPASPIVTLSTSQAVDRPSSSTSLLCQAIETAETEEKVSASRVLEVGGGKKAFVGIPYRVPVPVEVVAKLDGTVLKRDTQIFPEVGGVAWAAVESKSWTSNKTTLGFSTASGGMTSLTITSGSQALGVAEVVGDTTTQVTGAAQAIQAQQEKESADRATKLTSIVTNSQATEVEILKKENEIEEAGAAYVELQADLTEKNQMLEKAEADLAKIPDRPDLPAADKVERERLLKLVETLKGDVRKLSNDLMKKENEIEVKKLELRGLRDKLSRTRLGQ